MGNITTSEISLLLPFSFTHQDCMDQMAGIDARVIR